MYKNFSEGHEFPHFCKMTRMRHLCISRYACIQKIVIVSFTETNLTRFLPVLCRLGTTLHSAPFSVPPLVAGVSVCAGLLV